MAWSDSTSTVGSVADLAIVAGAEWHPLLDEILEAVFPTLWSFLNEPECRELLAAGWNINEMIIFIYLRDFLGMAE